MNGNNESSKAKEDKTPAASPLQPSPLLKILEDMLHNRITQKKKEIHKTTRSIADIDRVWSEIETLRWVLAQSLSIRKRIGHK